MAPTPQTFIEGQLSFRFGNTVWEHVNRYEASAQHKAICKRIQRVQAVDFVASGRPASPVIALIEVKDFRPPQQAFEDRKSNQIAEEVAQKVAGTLLGISASGRKIPPDAELSGLAKRATMPRRRLEIILHIEFFDWTDAKEVKAQLAVLTQLLEKALDWLPQCDVLASCELVPYISDCTVTTI